MPILTINAGSSSIKFSVFDSPQEQSTLNKLFSGAVSSAFSHAPQGSLSLHGQTHSFTPPKPGIDAAISSILNQVEEILGSDQLDIAANTIEAVGHRVVHGGHHFSTPALITPQVLEHIRDTSPLAPEHNPNNIAGILATTEHCPQAIQVAVFDTAFHQSLPPKAHTYPIPKKWRDNYHIRRYGFHGTSHQIVSQRAIQQLMLDPNHSRLLVAHLGNGCSAAAIVGGKSVDTTMGMTPLEGMMMGTRSGSIDPAIPEYLSRVANLNIQEITRALNQESGLLGMSGVSPDLRQLTSPNNPVAPDAQLAKDVFCYRIQKELCSLLPALGGTPDALVFTGGIGENAADIRAEICAGLTSLNFTIDPALNQTHGNPNSIISSTSSRLIAVIPTDEELAIANATRQFLPPAPQTLP